MIEGPRSYSTIEVAKRLGISLQTVQRWVDSGQLKAWKTPGGHRRIDAQNAEALFAQNGQASSPLTPERTSPGATPAPTEVVIVDDDLGDRELLAALVQEALPSARLRIASNGFQGLVMIAKFAPEVVVTDVHMPHMDGFEMIRNVLADAQTRPRLMIAVSARSIKELTEFGQLPSEVLLLQKPLERDAFIKALQSI